MARRGRHPPHRLCSPQAKEKSVCTNGPVNQTVILAGIGTTGLSRIRQKRRELQLSATQQFYAAYGEFFAVWKLWNRLDRSSDSAIGERQWELHKRAAAAEAVIEGTLVTFRRKILGQSSFS